MEGHSVEKQRHQWQGSRSTKDAWDASLCEAIICPCIVYGRTSNRLRAALGEHNPAVDDKCCVPDCIQFTFCFPFYGCLLAKLQTTVRSFYGVGGSDVSDWCAGCFCPCVTLVRSEKEIELRERHQQRVKNVTDRDSSFAEQYQPPDPMEPPVEFQTLSLGSPRQHNSQLPSIPDSLDVTHGPDVSPVAKQMLPSIAEEPSSSAVPALSVSTAHDLSQDTAVVAVHGKSKVHRLGDEEDIATLTTNPPATDTSDEVKHDATAEEVVQAAKKAKPVPKEKLAKLGSLISSQFKHPKPSSHESSEHVVDQAQSTDKSTDKSADKPTDIPADKSRQPVKTHNLRDDAATLPSIRGPAKTHDLFDDAVTPPSSRGPAVSHTLDEDEATSSPSKIPLSHKLGDDK
ncbi:hypothetical protein B0J13DRAFT_643910 [Dactylonectria estremocensis]|uniref:Uncharacterized protein n=1 Tax=Dactylonectria estremocensis TaxID=1079267 RepID=A0A9P9FF48_9HYPO|nr:hypothetical protein B0J13DRAFT_643910 [Dactylonectria estremocensis]